MKQRFLKRALAAALLLATAATGCWPAFEQPEVRVAAVSLGGLGVRGGTLIAHVVVSNPNRFQLRTQALSYALELGGRTVGDGSGDPEWIRLGEGRVDKEVSIEAKDSTIVEIPLDFTYSGVGAAIRSVLDRGTIDYRIAGDLRVSEPVRRLVPFRRSGTVTLSGTQ